MSDAADAPDPDSPDEPGWVKLTSSNLAACRYTPSTKTLEIRFNSGAEHSYPDIDQETYDGLVNASSPGKYFHANIRNR